jgi:acyl-CoA reductase-like NAD-dependent aldehyde dehydrogenase
VQKILINGDWVDAFAAATREIKNPATIKPLDTVPECGAEDVRRAVAAAKAAQLDWSRVPGAEKGILLREIGKRIRARRDALAALITLETGKPLCESLDCVGSVAACFEYHGNVEAFNDGQPFGVVAAIVPFNFPLLLMARKVASAIAAGNAVVCKPPHQNPLANLHLAELYEQLPPGVVNVVTGGADTGMALVDDPDVDLIAFTGSTSTGRQITTAAGARCKKLDLQAGTVAPIIILKDADLDVAVPGVAWERLRLAGQDCITRTRIYVESDLAAEFADRIHEYIAFLEVGDPIKPDTDLGPLISHEAARRVEEQVAHAVKEGARLKLGGRCFRPWGLPGHFFQPTILTDVRHGSVAAREEIFGPVLSITSVADVEEAMRFANDYGSGLNVSIYTSASRLEMHSHSTQMHLEHIIARKAWWFPYRDRKLA